MPNAFGLGRDGQIMNGSDGLGGSVTSGTVVSALVAMVPVGRMHAMVQLIAPSTLVGSWKIEFSNDVCQIGIGINQPPNAGRWSGIDSLSNPTLIPDAGTGGLAQNLGVLLSPFPVRAVRVTFTWVSGSGVPEVWVSALGG